MNDYSHLTITQQKAIDTRARRQAAGLYATPAQKAAMRRLLQRDGRKNLTVEDAAILSTYRHCTARQRAEFAAMVAQAQ